ncbi:MAG: hypothetical protein ACI9KE_002025 [Polyangiales bacterium]|jgi:hypothetical protein
MNSPFFTCLLLATLISLSAAPLAHAESWCARPLWVHEWGVQSFDGQGVPTAATLPPWFHRTAQPGPPASTPARHLPADGGERSLPVLHFYSRGSQSGSTIPIGIEVGFRRGAATHWYPQIQGLRTAAQANSVAAGASRELLVQARAARVPFAAPGSPLGRDLTRQLFWDRLELSAQPARSPHATTLPWIAAARDLSSMWVNGTQETERFVFYEGATRERPLIQLERGSRYSASRRHLIVYNRSAYPVHDVVLTHREGNDTYVIHVPRIPAGRRAGFILEEHVVADGVLSSRGHLRDRLIDAGAPTNSEATIGGCPMMRDPGVPTESAASHHLYRGEVDLILQTWGADFFDGPGTTLLYREDITYLDAMMPISIYTDMYNSIVLHRAGLAVQRGVSLP